MTNTPYPTRDLGWAPAPRADGSLAKPLKELVALAKKFKAPAWASHVAVRTDGSNVQAAVWSPECKAFLSEDPVTLKNGEFAGAFKTDYWCVVPVTAASRRQHVLRYAQFHDAAYGAPAPEDELLDQARKVGLTKLAAQRLLDALVQAGDLIAKTVRRAEGYVVNPELLSPTSSGAAIAFVNKTKGD